MVTFKKIRFFISLSLIGLFLNSCKEDSPTPSADKDTLANLPEDTGGTHIPQVLGSTASDYGYYVYLPGGYAESEANYPLLIFLHGKPERGDGSSDPEVLKKVLRNGPPKIIEKSEWDPSFPMIVVSPQYHGTEGNLNNWGGGDAEKLRDFIKFTIDKYRVNTKRIYLTGMSHGGNGVYDYLTNVEDSLNYIAAAVPVAAYGARKGVEKSRNTPIWVFIGDQDGINFTTSVEFVNKYNEQVPPPSHPARISVFAGVGHNVWARTYSSEGIGTADPSYDAFDISIYDWMFQHEKEE